MKSQRENETGVVYGMRHLDFFFFPRLRVTQGGIELIKKEIFVPWSQIKKIRRCDNALWQLTRGPLGSYLYYDDKTFWISARLIKLGASFREILKASFSHRTQDYHKLLNTIEEHIRVT